MLKFRGLFANKARVTLVACAWYTSNNGVGDRNYSFVSIALDDATNVTSALFAKRKRHSKSWSNSLGGPSFGIL